MERILVCGDIHGNLCNIAMIFNLASRRNCDRIHCVGDFGFFPAFNETYLKTCSELVRKHSIRLSFTDGNHEDHFHLNSLPETEERYVCEGIEWFYRGKIHEDILSIGGAHSIDKNHRTLAKLACSGLDDFLFVSKYNPNYSCYKFAIDLETKEFSRYELEKHSTTYALHIGNDELANEIEKKFLICVICPGDEIIEILKEFHKLGYIDPFSE